MKYSHAGSDGIPIWKHPYRIAVFFHFTDTITNERLAYHLDYDISGGIQVFRYL